MCGGGGGYCCRWVGGWVVAVSEASPGQVLMAKVTSVDRGACIRDLSQYPGEVRKDKNTSTRAVHARARTHARTRRWSACG